MDEIPKALSFTPKSNSNRIYLLLGLFIIIITIIFKVFFEDEIRSLILGDIYDKPIVIEGDDNKEVYNVSNNTYNYKEAGDVCRSLDAKLATHKQVVNAYKNGAEWCNYGWTEGQNALFPIQKETWERLQTLPEKYKNECGQKFGVNGGFFENSNLNFGANCYGVKPTGELLGDYKISSYEMEQTQRKVLSAEEIEALGINPFNKNQWSQYQ